MRFREYLQDPPSWYDQSLVRVRGRTPDHETDEPKVDSVQDLG